MPTRRSSRESSSGTCTSSTGTVRAPNTATSSWPTRPRCGGTAGTGRTRSVCPGPGRSTGPTRPGRDRRWMRSTPRWGSAVPDHDHGHGQGRDSAVAVGAGPAGTGGTGKQRHRRVRVTRGSSSAARRRPAGRDGPTASARCTPAGHGPPRPVGPVAPSRPASAVPLPWILYGSGKRVTKSVKHYADAGKGLPGSHVCVGDHVSFHDGTGFDGLTAATAALSGSDRLPVLVGVYLLALRHPLLTARQLASISQLAPGRLVLGAGVGGEDRSEVSNSGVDPATRGRRLDECLQVLRALASADAVDHQGEFFELTSARIKPAAELGRPVPPWYGINVWCGLDADAAQARLLLARQMESLYHLPFGKFERLAPARHPGPGGRGAGALPGGRSRAHHADSRRGLTRSRGGARRRRPCPAGGESTAR